MLVRRRSFLSAAVLFSLTGCKQTATVREADKPDMIGSHAAGAETFKPLVETAVGQLLSRHAAPVVGPSGEPLAAAPKRICFVAVENQSSEEIGDFKDQIYQIIDMHIVQSGVFQPVNKRFVDAGLMQTRLRPDSLMVAQNMRTFTAVMEQQGQPFDFLLYATLNSGTTQDNAAKQKDYLLTLELVNIHDGSYDKQAATISKGYYPSVVSKWMSQVGLRR